jgi:hypothetical protein
MRDSFTKPQCGNCLFCQSGKCLKNAPVDDLKARRDGRTIDLSIYPNVPSERYCNDWKVCSIF